MKFFIFTLGCQMNTADSEKVSAVLESANLKPATEKEANLIIVNACSVRQTAVDRIWGKLKVWKKARPAKFIFLTGCILPKDMVKLASKVDEIFSINSLSKLPNILEKHKLAQADKRQLKKRKLRAFPSIPYQKLKNNNYHKIESTAFIPIMNGCDNFCSYCVVPYTRGREQSRPEKEIICEAKKAIRQGHTNILLLGQNVNSYKSKSEIRNPKSEINPKVQNPNFKTNPFIQLIRKIDVLLGDFQFNFMTSHPKDLSSELIKTLVNLKKWEHSLHLPVQSGDDEILRKMNRHYSAKQYLNLIKNLKLKIKKLIISTDIIVGFPGETKKTFENTVKLCKKAKFNKAYVAIYSPRAGTAAHKLEDNVSREEKKKRWKILDTLINH